MTHKIEIVPNNAIYIDGERVIGSKPYGMFLTTTMIVSDEDLKRLSDRCLEVISDRKTEPSFKVDGIGDNNPTIHAIAYLQKVGWLQEHDRALTEPSNSEKPNNSKESE